MKKIFIFLLLVLFLGACAPKQNISVMSFNLRLSPNDQFDGDNSWLYRKSAVVKMLNEVQPDLLGIQEGLPEQVNYMEENLTQYGRYGVGRDAQARGEANAIFYKKERFELLECGTFWLSATPDSVSRGWDGACNRVVTWAKLKDKMAGGREIYYFNTHFDHIGKVAREESGKLIIAKIKEMVKEDTPIFLTGDFNANYDNKILNPIRNYMKMSRETAPISDTLNTFNNWGAIEPLTGKNIIDHIFYKNAAPLKYETLTGHYGVPFISDHYPIIANFKFYTSGSTAK